jgi:hypothetical protein
MLSTFGQMKSVSIGILYRDLIYYGLQLWIFWLTWVWLLIYSTRSHTHTHTLQMWLLRLLNFDSPCIKQPSTVSMRLTLRWCTVALSVSTLSKLSSCSYGFTPSLVSFWKSTRVSCRKKLYVRVKIVCGCVWTKFKFVITITYSMFFHRRPLFCDCLSVSLSHTLQYPREEYSCCCTNKR